MIAELARRTMRLAAALVVPLALLSPVAAAQAPASATLRLNEALRSLAQDPQYVPSLVGAGQASLALDDVDAALGFFRRAEAVAPADGRVKAGLAAVMVRQGQPLEALRLFAEAEQAGEAVRTHAADRGLAYDLIGDNARAQQDYQLALSVAPDPLVTRRLALSQAIAGDQNGSEATLLPLLQRSDLSAYRTRAFALAILGRANEAVSIAETMLPARLSSRMAPYLRYMPRLTRAQQAAAANLGSFPQAAQIGREDPALAAFAAQGGAPQSARGGADARLVPSGQALGPRASDSPIPQREGNVRLAAAAAPPAVAPATPASPPAPVPATQVAAAAITTPVPPPVQATPPPAPAPQAIAATGPASPPVPTPPPTASAVQLIATANDRPAPPPVEPIVAPAVVVTALPSPPPPQAEPPRPSLALAAPEQTPAAPGPAPAPPRDLSQAFAEFAAPAALTSPAQGAVDITRIEPKRETPRVEPRAAAPQRPVVPPKPVVPSRHWVQVATGRDTAALAFDWRRVKREAGGLLDRTGPHVATWGQTNRLVAGPFASAREADELVTKLKDKKVDSFRFTSERGEEVKKLD